MSGQEESSLHQSGTRSLHFVSSFAVVHWLPILAFVPSLFSQLHSSQAGSDSDIYARILLSKRIGYPLWWPTPPELPSEHRRQGINIGDVGKIWFDGKFLFLFNVFLNSDNPANHRRDLAYESLGRLDLDRNPSAHSPGKVIRSNSIVMSRSDANR